MSDYIPQEIIPNILFRLPIESLVRCTSVCKSWRAMIKDSSFIRAHLNNHHGSHLLLVHSVSCKSCFSYGHQSSIHGVKEEVYSLHYDNHAFDDYCEIGFQSPITDIEMYEECFRVVGICNGLVCIADDFIGQGYNFMIWNPSIRKLVTLPNPRVTFKIGDGYKYNASHGFGFDAITNDYKVVRLVTDRRWCFKDRNDNQKRNESQTFVEVFSLAAGSWSYPRSVDPKCNVHECSPQAFVNGALHWDARCSASSLYCYFILAFDVGSEIFRKIMMPKSLDWDSLRLWRPDLTFQLSDSGDGKSLALFIRYHSYTTPNSLLDIWVMKEYCVEGSWTKLITLHPEGPQRSLPKALCFRKSGEVVLVLKLNHECWY